MKQISKEFLPDELINFMDYLTEYKKTFDGNPDIITDYYSRVIQDSFRKDFQKVEDLFLPFIDDIIEECKKQYNRSHGYIAVYNTKGELHDFLRTLRHIKLNDKCVTALLMHELKLRNLDSTFVINFSQYDDGDDGYTWYMPVRPASQAYDPPLTCDSWDEAYDIMKNGKGWYLDGTEV